MSMSELDASLLTMGNQQVQQQQPNQHGLFCEFYYEAKPDSAASLEAGHPKFKEIPYIMIMVPGDKDTIIRRPVRTGQLPKHDNNRFHNEYIAFIQKDDKPIDGLPLSEWSQLSRTQALELNHFGIKTVEHLAEMSDANTQKFMGLFDLRKKAIAYLEVAKEDAPVLKLQAQIDSRDDELAAMKQQMEEMKTELGELKSPKRKKK